MAWAIVATALCFFYASSFWMEWFGRFGAFYAALMSFVLCFYGARLILHYADKLLEPYQGPFDSSVYENAPRDTFYRDWSRYAGDIVRNRRYALYARTRQWEKLRALEHEMAASRTQADAMPEPPHPRRTTMSNRVTFEENRRGSRRSASDISETRRWQWQATDD
jgi:hypothetical protein